MPSTFDIQPKNIAIIDTSILVLYLKVPNMETTNKRTGKTHTYEEIAELFNSKRQQKEKFILPMATIIETGNHIGQITYGKTREDCTNVFVNLIKKALDTNTPFTIIKCLNETMLESWVDDFQKQTGYMGFGDYSIMQDWNEQCELNKRSRVYIWSLDSHLQAYDREPLTK